MSLVSSTIPNLIGGISQQPASIRLKTQGSAQINGISDVVDGLQKRPGTEHIAKISTSALSGAFIHALKRDEDEAYIVLLTGTGTNVSDRIKIFDKSGVAKTVNVRAAGDTISDAALTSGTLYDAVKAYLAAGTPQTAFAATTIADYTFVLNNTITVAKSSTVSSKRNPEALVYIATGDYATDYKIEVRKAGTGSYVTAAELTTYDTSAAASKGYEKVIATNTIASELASDPGTEETASSDVTALDETLTSTSWIGGGSDPFRSSTSIAVVSNTGTVTQSSHGLTTGEKIELRGSSTAALNGNYTVTKTGDNTYTITTAGVANATYTDAYASYDFTITTQGSVIHIQSGGLNQDFDIQVTDSRGNVYTRVFKDQYPSFTRLPGHAPTEAVGMTVKITGDSAKYQDDFYVKLNDNKNGVWEETVGPGLQDALDADTLPIQLIKESDGSFSLKQTPWGSRVAGDDQTNDFPSFVGKEINDIFFHQNRLGVLADENVIFTESGEFYNWFSPTVLTSLETNPIDVAVSNNKVSILKHAVPFSESILIFSDLTQFIMKSSEYLSPTNVSLNVTTEFEADLTAKPVGAGRFVFFATDNGAHTGIREYFVEVDSETNDAVEITSHIPQYIKGGVKHLAASSNNDTLLVLSDSSDATKTMYVYRYFWQGTNKLQSAWSKFTFDSTVITAEFLQDEIYLVVQRGSNVYLEKLKLSQDDSVAIMSAEHPVHLDRRVKVTTTATFDSFTSTYYADGNSTDYSDNASVVYVSKYGELLGSTTTNILQGSHTGDDGATTLVDSSATFETNGAYNGASITNNSEGTTGTINAAVSSETAVSTTGAGLTWDTDETYSLTLNKVKQAITKDGFVYAGINYEFEYEFSEIMVTQGENDTPLTNGRLQVRNMTVLYSNTGYFTMEINASQRDADTYVFNGRITSDSGHTLNNTPLDTGSYKFPVLSKSSEVVVKLKNDTFLPCIFQSAEWEGLWNLRSQYMR